MISSIPREPEQFLRLLAFFGARRFLLPARRLSRTDETVTAANSLKFVLLDYEIPECRNHARCSELTPACECANGRDGRPIRVWALRRQDTRRVE